MASFQVPSDTFGAVCIVVDKLDKLPAEQVSLQSPSRTGPSSIDLKCRHLAATEGNACKRYRQP